MHEAYRQLGLSQGWIKPRSGKDKDFTHLAFFYKESNRAAARRMVSTLGKIGLALVPGKNTPAETDLIRQWIEYNLEWLAETEHEGWMEWHLGQGWQYGENKANDDLTLSPQHTTHPCLRPYLDLSDKERNKDPETVRRYLDFAAAGGMQIVPVLQPARRTPKAGKNGRSPSRSKRRSA